MGNSTFEFNTSGSPDDPAIPGGEPSSSGGDPRPRDAKATKAEIIAAAERLFLAKGYANTSMAEVADQVGVAKSLIYHHFGNKEALWEEVKSTIMGDYVAAQTQLFAGEHGVDVVRDSLVTYFDFLRHNPKSVRLNAWLELEGPPKGIPHLVSLAKVGIDMLRDLQQRGQLRDDIDPVHLMYAMIAPAEFWLGNRKRIGQIMNAVRGADESAEIDWDAEDKQFLASLLSLLLRGASPEPD